MKKHILSSIIALTTSAAMATEPCPDANYKDVVTNPLFIHTQTQEDYSSVGQFGSTNTGGTGGKSNTNTSSDFSNNGSSLFGGPSSKGATPYPSDNKTEKAGIMDLSPISLDWVDKHKNHLIRIKIPVMVIDATEGDIKKLTNTYPEISFGAAPENVATLKSIFTYYGIETYPAMLNDGWVFPE